MRGRSVSLVSDSDNACGVQDRFRLGHAKQAAHDEDPHVGVARYDVAQDIEAAAVRHMDIEQNKVPVLLT